MLPITPLKTFKEECLYGRKLLQTMSQFGPHILQELAINFLLQTNEDSEYRRNLAFNISEYTPRFHKTIKFIREKNKPYSENELKKIEKDQTLARIHDKAIRLTIKNKI